MKQSKSLQPHHKTLILHSVLRYVEKCGFSKTLKRFLSEAQIEDDKWKASSLDLEDLFSEYSNKCTTDGSLNIYKGKDLQTDCINRIDGNVEAGSASEETVKKKKKKKSNESDVKAGEDKSDVLEKNEDDTVTNELSKKHKDKKKKKSTLVTESGLVVGGEEKPEPLLGHNNDDDNNNPKVELETKDEKKKKKKEKKKDKPSNDSPALEDAPDNSLEDKKVEAKDKKGTEVLNSVTKESLNETLKKDKKSSKRKRLTEDENKNELVNEEAMEEEGPKRRKTEAIEVVEAAKSEDQLTKGDGHKPSKDQNEHENGKLDNNGGGKSDRKKSETKQNNGSAEPKSAKAFQRVKINEVEFADEKLQDNSYWAKDGAEIGYGAKAQEVLGQVRGRDFRHEKTKKKRGSYRGGQIDLDSHSIKFNYSDED